MAPIVMRTIAKPLAAVGWLEKLTVAFCAGVSLVVILDLFAIDSARGS
jgi:hypothetical protein